MYQYCLQVRKCATVNSKNTFIFNFFYGLKLFKQELFSTIFFTFFIDVFLIG